MGSTGIPGDAAAGHFAIDFELRTPLRQIHNVWRLVDAHHAVGRTSSELEAQMLRGEFNVGDAGARVDERSALDPRGGGGF